MLIHQADDGIPVLKISKKTTSKNFWCIILSWFAECQIYYTIRNICVSKWLITHVMMLKHWSHCMFAIAGWKSLLW